MCQLSAESVQGYLKPQMGYWHQRVDERLGKPPEGNQELLVVKHKVGRP